MTIFNQYNGQPDSFASFLISTPSGISIVGQSASYKGALIASSTFDFISIGNAVLNQRGILLTTGSGTPPQKNTSTSFTLQNNTLGDSDLGAIVQKAFSGAGVTADAAVLEFKINVDPGVKSVMFDVVFGSDEFPEWSNTKFVDIAAIIVNGKNAAFFGGDPKKPLSVLDVNKGYFQDNTKKGLPIEYDGISNKLTVIASVKPGENTIKIAIADTGDVSFDSGIFVSNMRGSTKDISGILNEVLGTDANDKLKAIKGIDNILIGGLGKDKLAANSGFDILYGDIDPTQGETGKSGDAAAASAGIFKDTFIFKSVKHLKKGIKKTDVIADFDKKDVIDFSKMTKSKLDFIGKAKFSKDGDGEVRYKAFKKADYTAVYVDTNGDGKTDASLKILGIHKLKDGDFVL